MESACSTAIIGGGIAGLSTAYHLAARLRENREDLQYLLVEKADRLGGNIFTEVVDGFIVEGGPDCIYSEKPAALELCRRLGLENRLLKTNEESRRTFILSKGKLCELPEGFILLAPTNLSAFLKSPLISPLGKLRMALDLIIPARKSRQEESLAQFVRRRLGKEALDRIAEPLVAGIHASDPETMSLQSTFPRFIEIENEYGSLIRGMIQRRKELLRKLGQGPPKYTLFMTLEEGLSELTEALAAALDPKAILTGQAVVRIEKIRTETNGRFSGYRIQTASGFSFRARSVILTTPAFVSADLLKNLDPGLAAGLAAIPYVSTATVSLAYRRKDVAHPLNGFGFVIPRLEHRKIMASTWSSVKFAHRAPKDQLLLRCFVGGAHNEALALLSEPELVAIARDELRDLLGISAEPLFARVYRWRKSMPQYTVGHDQKLRRIEGQLADHPGLFLAGSAYQGIGISDCVKSGDQAAIKVADWLKDRSVE